MAEQSYDPAQFLANLLQAGQQMVEKSLAAAGSPGAATRGFPGVPEMPSGSADPTAMWVEASKRFSEMGQEYMKQVTGFWTAAMGGANPWQAFLPAAADSGDKRFAGEAWTSDPRFDAIKRSYLAYGDFLRNSVEAAPVDERTKGQMRFAARQIVDAMSPVNFFATNPEAMQLAAETGGQSLMQGMSLFLNDVAAKRITITDERAFEVGKNLATTPGSVVFENDLIQLIQYKPTTEQVHEIPLVMIPPAINKFYILDLQPENSLVRYAIEQEHTVFMLSWRNITPELGHLTWDDYLQQGVMKAINVAREICDVEQVNTLGFCVGGTLLASALAVMKGQNEDPVASMTLLTTMLDFSDTGEIGLLISPESVAQKDAAIGNGGVMPGRELGLVFSSLRANDLVWPYVVSRYLKGKASPAFDMLFWNADETNLPGPMFCWYVRNTYLENRLREAGKTEQCGIPVDLADIDCPAFLYASREDHIVPWATAYTSHELLGGDTTFVLGASGHIAGVINPAAKNKRNYWTSDKIGADAETWLSTAESVPGSWWPKWNEWLTSHAGPLVEARKSAGSAEYKVIEAAPGRYVRAKAS
jgi:polyhydroxyalkanoate synthase